MSLIVLGSTYANVVAERDAALAKIKVLRKLADERKVELKKSGKALETLNKKYDWLNTEDAKVREAKEKANLSAEVWKSRAETFVKDVKSLADEITSTTLIVNTSSCVKEFNRFMNIIEGQVYRDCEAKEKAEADLAKESEAKRCLEAWKRRAVNEIYDYYINLTAKPDSDYVDEGRRRVKKDEPNAFDFALNEIKEWQSNWCKDTDALEEELKKENATLKAEKAALEATVNLRDEEIARLRAENASLNTRFDAISSMATENIISRYQRMINNNGKRARITD